MKQKTIKIELWFCKNGGATRPKKQSLITEKMMKISRNRSKEMKARFYIICGQAI